VKEKIEKTIDKWADDAETYMTQQQKSDLATRLDKAIEIDKERVRNIIKDNARDYLLHGNLVVKVGELSKAIAQSRPLKCEVDMVGFEGTYDALNKLTRRKA